MALARLGTVGTCYVTFHFERNIQVVMVHVTQTMVVGILGPSQYQTQGPPEIVRPICYPTPL